MSLKSIVAQKISNEMIREIKKYGNLFDFLTVDEFGMKVIASVFKLSELKDEGIKKVQLLYGPVSIQNRGNQLIYLITPTDDSFQKFNEDYFVEKTQLFQSKNYLKLNPKAINRAHVFLTENCPEILLYKLCKFYCSRNILTLKEININFLAFESQAFNLDLIDSFQYYFNPTSKANRLVKFEQIAERLTNVCELLGEYPIIRYKSDFDYNIELAQLIKHKFNKNRYYEILENNSKQFDDNKIEIKSQLLILDRGFDCISPLLHECTFQAMVYDILPIKKDIYIYVQKQKGEKEVNKQILLKDGETWNQFKHANIVYVAKELSDIWINYSEELKILQNTKEAVEVAKKLKSNKRKGIWNRNILILFIPFI